MLTSAGAVAIGAAWLALSSEWWIGIHLADPGWAGSLATELDPIATGIGRVNMTGKLSVVDPSTGIFQTSEIFETAVPLIDAGAVTYFSLNNAEIGGTMFDRVALKQVQNVYAGVPIQRPPGGIWFRLR